MGAFIGMGLGCGKGRHAAENWGLILILLSCSLALPGPSTAQVAAAEFSDIVAKASAARDAHDVPKAIDLYQQALKLNSRWPDGWWYLGSMEYGNGSYEASRDALSHYLDLTPNAPAALAMRGLCEFETADYAQSLKDIQHALAVGAANQPRNEEILRYHESLLLTRTGNFEDALRSYGFFAHDPDPNPELLLAIGMAGLRVPLLPRELKADQQPMYINAGKAAFDFMKGDKDAARAEFQHFFEQFPTAANAHYLYGYLLYPTDVDAGSAEFKRELEVAPTNATAEAMLAWILFLQNRPSDALPYAEHAVTHDPELPSGQLVLGRALTETGNARAGLEHLTRALARQPDNLEIHLALARAYSETGRKEDARRERLLCLEMTKNDAILLPHQ